MTESDILELMIEWDMYCEERGGQAHVYKRRDIHIEHFQRTLKRNNVEPVSEFILTFLIDTHRPLVTDEPKIVKKKRKKAKDAVA